MHREALCLRLSQERDEATLSVGKRQTRTLEGTSERIRANVHQQRMWRERTKAICECVNERVRVKDTWGISCFGAHKITEFNMSHHSTAFSHQVPNTLT